MLFTCLPEGAQIPGRPPGEPAGPDAWGSGQTLEWATPSPPPPENFDGPLPPIRSNRPVWDVHHPPPELGVAVAPPGATEHQHS